MPHILSVSKFCPSVFRTAPFLTACPISSLDRAHHLVPAFLPQSPDCSPCSLPALHVHSSQNTRSCWNARQTVSALPKILQWLLILKILLNQESLKWPRKPMCHPLPLAQSLSSVPGSWICLHGTHSYSRTCGTCFSLSKKLFFQKPTGLPPSPPSPLSGDHSNITVTLRPSLAIKI